MLAYFDSLLTLAAFADRIDEVTAGMAAALADTTARPVTIRQIAWSEAGSAEQRDWSPAARDALLAALHSGRPDVFSLNLGTPDDEKHWHFEAWRDPFQPAAALSLSLSPTGALWEPDETDDAAERVAGLLLAWQQPLDLCTGGVTYDRTGPHLSPWDAWYTMDHRISATLTRHRVRGYYWWNLLTGGHLARLGGPRALGARAAALGLAVLPAGPATVLRFPGPITAFADDRLSAVKEALTPVLIPRRYIGYSGYPLRMIADPGTAFRQVPPRDPYPRLTAGGGPLPAPED
ncbi:hypothetical protein [Micromonospora sp. LH3U1]|uniref:hypothetical protein n=1 Tax=Micromonospora sp. LH3U1 TaxID=3018339 RepID=UPI002349CF3C|nr:hypothetical protein [Micromonospora sp. LH3U1]WCN79566.1 hypothetical protein PCA76_21420 [Micromonospora sp. LH3U1]